MSENRVANVLPVSKAVLVPEYKVNMNTNSERPHYLLFLMGYKIHEISFLIGFLIPMYSRDS